MKFQIPDSKFYILIFCLMFIAGVFMFPSLVSATIRVNPDYENFTYIGRGTDGGTTLTYISPNSTDFDYFPDDAVVNDAIYFGWNQGRWDSLKLYVGTAFQADDVTFVWEYWNGSDWATLSVTDNTNGFTNLGENTVEFTPPTDWKGRMLTFSGSNKYHTLWIRCRIAAVTNITEGGAQSTTTAKHKRYEIEVTGDYSAYTNIFKKIYEEDQANGWGLTELTEEGIQINCNVKFGDGSTQTIVKTQRESVSVKYDNIRIMGQCTFTAGVLSATGYTYNGSRIEMCAKGNDMTMVYNGATAKFYDTQIIQSGEYGVTKRIHFSGDTDFQDVIFEGFSRFCPDKSTVNVKRFKMKGGRWFGTAVGTVEDVILQSNEGNMFTLVGTVTARDLEVESSASKPFRNYRAYGTMIDCDVSDDLDNWTFCCSPGYWVKFQQSFNLKVIDKDNNPIEGATVTLKDKNGTQVFSVTTNASGVIPEQLVTRTYFEMDSSNSAVKTEYNPFTLTISHQDYPPREFKVTIDKPIDWTIALKDRPMSAGSIKVWGTEYASDEAGTIYAQVFYGDGSPCNTLDSSSITATVYKSDGTKIIDGAEMTYVEGSNGIYKYDFPANTFSEEGVYIIDVKVDSTDPNITAYNSNEIHISKSANLISQNLDQKISEVASSVWSYTGSALDTTGNAISKIWSYTGPALDTAGNAISKIWSYTGSALDTAGNAIAKVWSYATRKLTSRQIAENEYIAGVSSSSVVSQVADQPTQENVEYNVELVRKATFDFAGFADSGSTTTLVDSELEGPDNYWQYYKVIFMSGNNFGEERVITSYDADSHTLSWDPDNPLPYSVSANDKYVLSHEHRLVYKIWSYADRGLTSVGNIASAVWGWTTRSLTTRQIGENEYIAGVSSSSTVTQVASSEQAENIQSSINNLQTDITYIRSKVDDIYSDTQYIKGKVDNILNKWGSYSAQDIMTDLDTIKSRIGTSTDSSSDETLFGRTKYIQEKWGTQTAQAIYDKAESARALIAEVQTELGYHGTSTTAYADLQLIKGYVDDLEGYVGTPSDDSSAETLFGRIKGVKEGTDKLIENIIVAEASVNDSNASTTQFITNLSNSTDDFYNDNVLVFTSGANAGQVRRIADYDGSLKKITVDPALAEAPANSDTFSILSQTAVAGIDAQTIWSYGTRTLTAPDLDSGSLATLSDLQKQWTVYLSDFGEVLAGNTYRAKLWVLNYESVPTDANTTPTLTIYDAVRNKVVENVEMTKISTGIYEYTYSVPSSAVQGVWETDVSVEVEAGKIIKRNDYWEVEGSPAQVKINSISDNTVPSISANVTISNEGSAGYEYQYEWCVVSSEDNACGGGDDVFYSSAAKYIEAGQDWNTTLNATVSNTGSYWFKVVVYYSTEKSGASQTFTAIEEEEAPSPGGGGGGTVSEKEEKEKPSTLGAVWNWIKKILKRLTRVEKKTTTLTASVARLEMKLAELDKKMVRVLRPAPPRIVREKVIERRVVVRKPMPQVPRRRARVRLEGR